MLVPKSTSFKTINSILESKYLITRVFQQLKECVYVIIDTVPYKYCGLVQVIVEQSLIWREDSEV